MIALISLVAGMFQCYLVMVVMVVLLLKLLFLLSMVSSIHPRLSYVGCDLCVFMKIDFVTNTTAGCRL